MCICSDRFQVVLIGQIGIGSSGKAAAEHVAHGFYDVFLPQEAVPPPRSKVAHFQARDAAQPLHLFPQLGFGPGIENIQFEFAQTLEASSSLQFANGRKCINLPHRRLCPKAAKGESELPILNRELIIREPEVAFEPLQESRFKDTASSIEGIACEPDQLGLMKSQLLCLVQLFPKLIGIDQIAKVYLHGTIDERKRSACLRELLPDEL